MRVVIEFHRVRAVDGARAKIGSVTREVVGTQAAIELAASLGSLLSMPQSPDIVTIADERGNTFFCSAVGGDRARREDTFGIGAWENEGGAIVESAETRVARRPT